MRGEVGTQIAWPKPGRTLMGLMGALVVVYVLELLLLRANVSFVGELFLVPHAVFERGAVWQLFTYSWLHSPSSPSHLLMNLLWLWMMGTRLEQWWGGRRFLIAYLVCGVGGGVFTLLIGLLSKTSVFAPLLGGFWSSSHLGASGAVMGIVVAFGFTFANEDLHLLFLGRMKGKTFVLIIVAIDLLVALSFAPVSSSSHFGGMIAAAILTRGLWKPSRWKQILNRANLDRRRRKLENELRVIDGGKDTGPKKGRGPTDPSQWN